MNKTIKNLFSYPYNSKLIFQITEKILNKTSGGYILSFHDRIYSQTAPFVEEQRANSNFKRNLLPNLQHVQIPSDKMRRFVYTWIFS